MELKEWTHKYRYKMDLPNFVPRVGNVLTGTVQVSREYSDDEVEALAKEMSHGIFNNARLVEVQLIEVRTMPPLSNALGQEPCADVCARSPAPLGCASNGDTEDEV